MAHPAEAGYTLVQQPASNDPMQVHIYELDNGLQVYLTANREEPRFYAEIIVRAGSKHDPQDATGIAHYLEHMLFKGSRQLGTLDFESEKSTLNASKRSTKSTLAKPTPSDEPPCMLRSTKPISWPHSMPFPMS